MIQIGLLFRHADERRYQVLELSDIGEAGSRLVGRDDRNPLGAIWALT